MLQDETAAHARSSVAVLLSQHLLLCQNKNRCKTGGLRNSENRQTQSQRGLPTRSLNVQRGLPTRGLSVEEDSFVLASSADSHQLNKSLITLLLEFSAMADNDERRQRRLARRRAQRREEMQAAEQWRNENLPTDGQNGHRRILLNGPQLAARVNSNGRDGANGYSLGSPSGALFPAVTPTTDRRQTPTPQHAQSAPGIEAQDIALMNDFELSRYHQSLYDEQQRNYNENSDHSHLLGQQGNAIDRHREHVLQTSERRHAQNETFRRGLVERARHRRYSSAASAAMTQPVEGMQQHQVIATPETLGAEASGIDTQSAIEIADESPSSSPPNRRMFDAPLQSIDDHANRSRPSSTEVQAASMDQNEWEAAEKKLAATTTSQDENCTPNEDNQTPYSTKGEDSAVLNLDIAGLNLSLSPNSHDFLDQDFDKDLYLSFFDNESNDD